VSTRARIVLGVLAVVVAAVGWVGWGLYGEISKAASDDPLVWESAIAAFEAEDRRNPPLPDAVVFVGSSSIRMWGTLAEDMAPLPTIQRGFGGAKVPDVVHYAERIVTPYAPRAVVVYVGGNDLSDFFGSQAKRPDEVVEGYRRLVEIIWRERPDTPIYFVALKPTTLRAENAGAVALVNSATRAYAEDHAHLHFIDASPGLLLPDGTADPDKLLWDGIHLNTAGYAAWSAPIRARLLADLN
jgi:lysophospholipase L1-like esterase